MASTDFQTWLIVGAVLFGTIFITVLAIRYVTSSLKKKLAGIQGHLGGEIVSSLFYGTYLKLNDSDGEIRVVLVPAGKNTPARLTLVKYRALPFPLHVYKENFATRGLSKWGLMQDIKIGDVAFDETYVIRSSDPLRARNFLQDTKNRERIDRLFDAGFDYFRVDTNSSSTSKPNYTREDLEPSWVQEYLTTLSELIG